MKALALILYTVLALFLMYMAFVHSRKAERSSSFVGYSQSCWQVGDTLHVVTAKGDTVRLDVSRLEDTK